MAQKIYLSTFSLKVSNNTEEAPLLNFNGNEDFFDFFQGFLEHIFQNVKKTHSYGDKVQLHLTLDEPAIIDRENRTIYGFLSSGVGGDKYKVRADGETETAFESDPKKHITFRNLFFFVKMPKNLSYGYLIIQKKRDLGAKRTLEGALNTYFREKGYQRFYTSINNLLNARVFERMMSLGNLKNIDLIKKSIPSTIEDLYEKGAKKEKGTLTTSIRGFGSLGKYWKDFIRDLYGREHKQAIIEIRDEMDSVDEVEFELEMNGKIKTFHVFAKNRTQPDVEVSDNLVFVENEPTIESLVEVSASMIEDMLTLKPNVTAD